MVPGFAYFVSVLRKDFVTECSRKLAQDHITLSLLYPILYIGKHPSCSPKELTQAMNMDWGFTQRSLDKLASEHLISRQRDEKNRRCYHLELTDEGCRLYHKSHDLICAWNEQKLSVLTPDEQAQLTTLLEKIVQAEGENSHV